MPEIIAITGKEGLPLIASPNKELRPFQPTAALHFSRYIKGLNGSAPIIQKDSTVILDARAFEGGGDGIPKMRDYLKAIRAEYPNGSGPRILCLRLDMHDEGIAKNDIKAGATATLFYMGNIPDATRRMNTFIETGALPLPKQGRISTVVGSAPFNDLFHHVVDTSSEDYSAPDELAFPPRTSQSDPRARVARAPSPKLPPGKKNLSGNKAASEEKMIKNAQLKHEPPAASESLLQRIAVPTKPETPTLGDQEMEALLIELRAMNKQNAQILATLEGIRDSIHNLRAEKTSALLAEAQKKVTDVFAQLQGGNDVHPTEIPASVSPTPSTAPSPGAVEIPASASQETPPIATATKGEPFMTNVSLFGKTVTLQHLSAELFVHLVNTGETMGTTDIASLYAIAKQGSYARMSKLHAGLDTFRKGLSSCLTPIKSGKSISYRFDEEAFRRIMKVK